MYFPLKNETLGEKELTYEDIVRMIETKLESITNTTNTLAPSRTLGEELHPEVMNMIETKLESVNNTTDMLSTRINSY